MRAIAKAQVTRLAIQDHLIRILIIFRVPTSETCRHGNFVARLESNFAQCHRSEEHTSELQSLMRISYAVFCLKKKKHTPLVWNSSYHTYSQQYQISIS